MKIRTFKKYTEGKFRGTIIVEEPTENESRWIDEQGDPEVNVGGEFDIDVNTSFTLPDQYVNLLSGFSAPGYTFSVDSADYENARDRADTIASTISGRIEDAMVALAAAAVAGYNGETVIEITYP